MNILIDEFPEAIEISGSEYSIHSDFRTALRIIMAFEDNELTGMEKQHVLLANLYDEKPKDVELAFKAGLRFLNMGEENKEDDDGPRVYSFTKDATLIFAAFRQTHGVDLATTDMHWWKFLALFMDLGSETAFCSLVGLRRRVKTGKATKEERRAAREMGDIFNLPEIDTRSLEEREAEAEFMRLLGSGVRDLTPNPPPPQPGGSATRPYQNGATR